MSNYGKVTTNLVLGQEVCHHLPGPGSVTTGGDTPMSEPWRCLTYDAPDFCVEEENNRESEMIWDIFTLRPGEFLSLELALRPERGKVVQCGVRGGPR